MPSCPSSSASAAALLAAALTVAGCTTSVAGTATVAPATGAPGERQLVRGTWQLEYTTTAAGPESLELTFDTEGGFSTPDDGDDTAAETYELSGADLSLCFNDCFARYEGSWAGDHFEGTAENDSGLQWDWTLVADRAGG
jgi:hypothetical protein